MITVYTKEGCKYCDYTKQFMDSENIKHKVILVDKCKPGYSKKIRELKDLSDGHSTFPYIFVKPPNGKIDMFVGGYTTFVDKYNNLSLDHFGIRPEF